MRADAARRSPADRTRYVAYCRRSRLDQLAASLSRPHIALISSFLLVRPSKYILAPTVATPTRSVVADAVDGVLEQ